MRRLYFSIVISSIGLSAGCSGPATAPVTSGPQNSASATAVPHPACHDRRIWGSYLRDDSAATIDEILQAIGAAGVALSADQNDKVRAGLKPVVKWRLIRFLLVEGQNHNFGTVTLDSVTRADGKPLRLYRSGFTTRPELPDSCFRSLLGTGEVRHVVNLYAGVMPTQDLEAAERSAAEAAGASYFTARDADPALSSWRYELEEHSDDPKVVREAMEVVAKLLNEQVLRPGGGTPQGNIHLHCGGGMHRTGMLVGILDKCLNQRPMADIEADYKHHVDWRSDDRPGGYETNNVAFIAAFDCSLLNP